MADLKEQSKPAQRPEYKLTEQEQKILMPLLHERDRSQSNIEVVLNLIHCQQRLEGVYGISTDGTRMIPTEVPVPTLEPVKK